MAVKKMIDIRDYEGPIVEGERTYEKWEFDTNLHGNLCVNLLSEDGESVASFAAWSDFMSEDGGMEWVTVIGQCPMACTITTPEGTPLGIIEEGSSRALSSDVFESAPSSDQGDPA